MAKSGPHQPSGVDAQALLDTGLVVEDFIDLPRVRELRHCASLRQGRGEFAAARVGGNRSLARREDIRGDHTGWWNPPLFAAERALLEDLEQIRLALNQEAALGLFELEIHYAWYPAGTAYARHVDQVQGRTQRQLSLVLYLNEGWQPGDGGELRVYDAAGGHRDVEPLAGRLVCFLSAGREHEVLRTNTDRWSLTGWFKRRE